jgi:GNAT superfamily N-acetyltransferase
MNIQELTIGEYVFSTDRSRLDVSYVHDFLCHRSYWAAGIPRHIVEKSLKNSLAVGIYKTGQQVGFARVITDFATYAYLCDVFIDETHRGKGLSKKLMEFIFSFAELQGLRRMMLATKDAHALYAQFGFKALMNPDRFMELPRTGVYEKFKSPG